MRNSNRARCERRTCMLAHRARGSAWILGSVMNIRTRRSAGVAAVVVAGVAGAGLAVAPSLPRRSPSSSSPRSPPGAHWRTASRGHGHALGRRGYVAFPSAATNLVPGDTNGVPDVFVRDLTRGLTRRRQLDTAGGPADRRRAGVPTCPSTLGTCSSPRTRATSSRATLTTGSTSSSATSATASPTACH